MTTTLERFQRFYSEGEPSACWLWTGATSGVNEYGAFWMDGRMVGAHVAAWTLANRRHVPAGAVVRHHCDVRLCVNPAHLEIGTAAENSADMVERDRQLQGADHHSTPFTADDIIALRERYQGGTSIGALATETGISVQGMSAIIAGEVWRSVTRGIDLRRPPTSRREEILALLDEGLTQVQVAERLGMTQAGVSYHVRRAGALR